MTGVGGVGCTVMVTESGSLVHSAFDTVSTKVATLSISLAGMPSGVGCPDIYPPGPVQVYISVSTITSGTRNRVSGIHSTAGTFPIPATGRGAIKTKTGLPGPDEQV